MMWGVGATCVCAAAAGARCIQGQAKQVAAAGASQHLNAMTGLLDAQTLKAVYKHITWCAGHLRQRNHPRNGTRPFSPSCRPPTPLSQLALATALVVSFLATLQSSP